MSFIGRGGEGDAGQRIRDEILVIQVNAGSFLLVIFYLFSFSYSVLKSQVLFMW